MAKALADNSVRSLNSTSSKGLTLGMGAAEGPADLRCFLLARFRMVRMFKVVFFFDKL